MLQYSSVGGVPTMSTISKYDTYSVRKPDANGDWWAALRIWAMCNISDYTTVVWQDYGAITSSNIYYSTVNDLPVGVMLRLAARRGSLWALRYSNSSRNATSSAFKPSSSVFAVLANARSSQPLKDAAKFYGDNADIFARPGNPGTVTDGSSLREITLWSYNDLEKHVRALASGLTDIGISHGHKVAVLLPPGSQEYIATLLAAADLGVTVVALEPPSNPKATNDSEIKQAFEKYHPEAFILWHDYKTADTEDSIYSTGANSVISALCPSLVTDDSRGTSGFTRITGRPLSYPEFPHLKWVIHTGDAHIRGAISFKSLLVYNGSSISGCPSASNVALIEASTGRQVSVGNLFEEAQKLGKELQLTDDPYVKAGKMVVRPEASVEAAAALMSALTHETLLISAGCINAPDRSAKAAELENALLV